MERKRTEKRMHHEVLSSNEERHKACSRARRFSSSDKSVAVDPDVQRLIDAAVQKVLEAERKRRKMQRYRNGNDSLSANSSSPDTAGASTKGKYVRKRRVTRLCHISDIIWGFQ